MVSKKIKILYFISISIFITYTIILFLNYSKIPETIATHINIKGVVDGHGNKKSLWITTGVNLILIIFFGLLIKNPQSANFPVEITDSNRASVLKKMQLFISILAIISTAVFSYMIFKALKWESDFIYLVSYLIIAPILTLIYFRKK